MIRNACKLPIFYLEIKNKAKQNKHLEELFFSVRLFYHIFYLQLFDFFFSQRRPLSMSGLISSGEYLMNTTMRRNSTPPKEEQKQ